MDVHCSGWDNVEHPSIILTVAALCPRFPHINPARLGGFFTVSVITRKFQIMIHSVSQIHHDAGAPSKPVIPPILPWLGIM